MANGLSAEKLYYFGLEYRFITSYLLGKLDYEEMFGQLLQAIRRFAKKQETWFRRMERQGFQIKWLDVGLPLEEKLATILETIKQDGV
jgi:tRNA dimethylallyltransferase